MNKVLQTVTHKAKYIVSMTLVWTMYMQTHFVYAQNELRNPLKSRDIPEFLGKIIDIILVFALPIIVLFIMYAGYLFVTANGKPEQIKEARNALLYAVIGGVIVLGARMIFTVIQGTANAL